MVIRKAVNRCGRTIEGRGPSTLQRLRKNEVIAPLRMTLPDWPDFAQDDSSRLPELTPARRIAISAMSLAALGCDSFFAAAAIFFNRD